MQPGEQAQSWRFSMPRLKGSAVEGSFTLIEGKQGWRGFIDFNGKSRRAVHDIVWRTPQQVTFRVDTWMGDTRPVFTLQQDKLSGYTLVGNVRYPTRGDKLAAVPAGKMPVVPDEKGQANILGGEAALWAENVRAPLLDLAVAARLRGGGAAVVGAGRHRRKQHVPAAGGDRRLVGGVGRPAAARGNGA